MPSTVTAFSVRITAPVNAATEPLIAREVIARWNVHQGLKQRRTLLALDDDSNAGPAGNDVLISFFCNCPGARSSAQAAKEEIERQLKGGKPALVYFNKARVDLTGDPGNGACVIDEWKKRFASAVIDSYGDDKELRAKIAQHLDDLISRHDWFNIETPPNPPPREPAVEKPLSECAMVILFEACDDFEGYIGHVKANGQLKIQANGRQLVEQQDPATVAKWEAAFNELIVDSYIRDAGCNGQLYQISTKGFDFLKTIGRNPVGYIPELGGM